MTSRAGGWARDRFCRDIADVLLLIAFAFVSLFEAAFAQTYQYSEPTPIFGVQRRILPQQTYRDWDEACAAALYPGGEQTWYANPRGGYHPQYGPGCFYDYSSPSGGTIPNYFAQNWATPHLACAYSPSWLYVSSLNLCRQTAAYNESKVCPLSNPVDPASGAKRQIETDIEFVVAGTRIALDRVLFTESLTTTFLSEFGHGWTSDPWDRAVRFRPNSTSPQTVHLWRKGKMIPLVNAGGGVWRSNPYVGLQLTSAAGSWLLQDQAEGSLELYDSSGRLISIQMRSGLSFSLSYSAGLLSSVASSIGSLFSLSYTQNKVTALTAADGRQVSYAFHPLNGDLLSTVTYPDQRSRSYLYEPENAPLMTIPSEAALLAQLSTAAGLPQSLYTGPSTLVAIAQRVTGRASRLSLTGIVDELGNRFATYAYDAQGRAVLSEHAGVERYQFNYATAYTQTVVTDPLGTQRTYNFVKTLETLRQTSQSQPAGSGCGPASSAISYDAQANLASRNDFNNQKVCYAYDLSRNLETKRVEGLTSSAVCSTALSSPPTGARIISTQWHPDWRLETRIAEPKKLTTITYNGQGATCAPSTVLVDGKPPAVICTRTEQATTDETGAAGFAATTTGTARTWRYTYTTYGRVLTAIDPNNRTTTTTYHPDNDADLGKRGNVASITNAANHITYITDYNAHGQPTRIVDPNGMVTVLTYDPRLRLTSRTVGSEATVFGYDPVGQMTSVDLPDGARLTYTYDAAHRLTAINDHKGNRIDYTLDEMGNRRVEQMKDPGGVLVGNIARVIDALNRVQRITGVIQ